MLVTTGLLLETRENLIKHFERNNGNCFSADYELNSCWRSW